ncbi:glycoside hydrolase family 43 protein [Spirochaetales bacterium NM-380-WT-3C1]|uniref:Glycoside hydrolase family 43 protein n=1 Tax=Bullifex porci TaxID=2606638 RepID=A0A7X2PD17_9SPIO|nr:family 43 glycosylhydrolase [Bullifex porci]MSU06145.1 glycoside hydrolase family 43 protein [Bullifex porci]
MEKALNPILRGFNPDPSIIRVGDDYYIATSTFEWWPGVKLSHSRDLVNWSDYGYILTDPNKLDLRGVGTTQGIWAPCLTYDKGIFYLCYTVVKAYYVNMYDTENYIVTSTSIDGPWSDPVSIDSFGFDPSLFHDDDGRKYLISMVTDHRVPKKYQGRLLIEELDSKTFQTIGEPKEIYASHEIFLEGPHILKKDGWYYLFAADTGTGEGHGESVLRSKNVFGPYEMHKPSYIKRSEGEAWSILTSRQNPEYPLQKSGHGCVVQTPAGEWYMVHITARPSDRRNPNGEKRVLNHPRFPNERRYPLGRETAIVHLIWGEDGWPRVDGGVLPPLEVPICVEKENKGVYKADFSNLDPSWQSLRIPMTEHYMKYMPELKALRMYGRSGLSSFFSQTLIARRIEEMSFNAELTLTFEPECFKNLAGLAVMYDTDNYLYLHITHDEDVGKCITLLKGENRSYEYLTPYIPIEDNKPIKLFVSSKNFYLSFAYSVGDGEVIKIKEDVDGSFMSDEACFDGWFTGSMIAICCQDLTARGRHCDVFSFSYENLKNDYMYQKKPLLRS